VEAAGHTGEVVARHVSPDGKLVWRVQRDVTADGNAEYSGGFEGRAWHLHAELMSRGGDPLANILALTDDLLADRLVIVKGSRPMQDSPSETDVAYWLLDELEGEVEFNPNDSMLEFRFWSGRRLSVEDLIDGKVEFLGLSPKYF